MSIFIECVKTNRGKDLLRPTYHSDTSALVRIFLIVILARGRRAKNPGLSPAVAESGISRARQTRARE
jgi:hypothetical protein